MDATIYSVTPRDKKWPALLRELPEKAKPKKLFVKGALPPADALIISIVGTRKPTSYGREIASQIVRALAPFRVVVASGMAIGLDAIAHRTALEEKLPTLAILGCGLDEDVLYPKMNLTLARDIISGGGALISEYEHDKKPELWTFPERNRIIAGIAHALIVVEAGEKSGALITARFALEFGRNVYALPGPIWQSKSHGTNALIKEGATPIITLDDLIEDLGFAREHKEKVADPEATKEEHVILQTLCEDCSIDEIIKKTRMAPDKVLALTTELEIRGLIRGMGGIFRKI